MYMPPMFKSDRAAGLRMRQPDDGAQKIAKQMVAPRPQLEYTSAMPVSASEPSRNVP
jgi:hypothetical protein